MKSGIYMRIYVEDNKIPTYIVVKETELPLIPIKYVIDGGIVRNSNITTRYGTPFQEISVDYVHGSLYGKDEQAAKIAFNNFKEEYSYEEYKRER